VKWILSVVVLAFALGYLAGRADLRLPLLGADRPSAPGVALEAPDSTRRDADAGSRTGGVPDAADGWPALLDEVERLGAAGLGRDARELRETLFAAARARAAAGELAAARTLLEAYRAVDPYDGELLLLESELLQQGGRLRDAMQPLLTLLGSSSDAGLLREAREQLRLLVNVEESQLATRQDHAALIRLFEQLTALDPFHDGHRLKLAHWLLRDGRLADAERVARELGLVGISEDARDDLLQELLLARSGLPFEQDARGIHVRATLGGAAIRLLVDTGASTTVISRDAAAALTTRILDRQISVRTAGGAVNGELHRVQELRIGGLHLAELDVLVLDHLPAGVDGLLGMDVLSRIPAPLLPATLLGRPPVSG